jgi:DNA-binding Xre family transcriptional regulator
MLSYFYTNPGGERMIKYDRLWETMKRRGITQYDLYTHHNINRSVLDRLRKNMNLEVNTIDRLCNILNCRVEDIMEHFPDDNHF